ncbi:hypothetical protein FSP39_014041 [Pinctada imbricata]|uniref:Reverse transcriptase domain-containing protein n=1 Tax=Pinctada imbricata TaxID=66713 RepID=A0AA89BUT1_PINIB|nr:hypothetical protein FSP39_014041 [Pinctada imbricata]
MIYIASYVNRISFLLFLSILIILLSGDVELNPGPAPSPNTTNDHSNSNSSYLQNDQSYLHNPLSLFSVIHLNVQSLKPKLDIIESTLNNIEILCFTESWLNSEISDDEIKIKGFHLPFRCDRETRQGGGVTVYVRENLVCKRRTDLEVKGLENVWIEADIKHETFLIGTFYRPPNSTATTWDQIQNSISAANDTNVTNILVLGDFNENQFSLNPTKMKLISASQGLTQLLNKPTSITEFSETLIDLILTNNTNIIHDYGVLEPFLEVNKRFHRPTFCLINSKKIASKKCKRTIFLYEKGNYELLKIRIKNENLDNRITEEKSIDDNVKLITEIIVNTAKECIPNKEITIRKDELPWITNEIRREMRKRNRARNKAKKSNNTEDWGKFKKIRNNVVNLLRKSKNMYNDKTCKNIEESNFSSKQWWKLVNQIIGQPDKNSQIHAIKTDADCIIYDDTDKANALNDFFVSQSTLTENNTLPDYQPVSDQPSLDKIIITEQDVLDVIKNLDTSKASGPDAISPKMIKPICNEIAKPLSKIFNLSLKNQKFPSDWKIANVIPVFKKKDPLKVENYRPISLLCIIAKIFEKCIYKYLHNFIVFNHLITPHQSGFTKNDNTVNQLLFLSNEISRALDDGKEFRTVFFDISKAFDRVWHAGLIFKLKRMGINGEFLGWVADYLSERKQAVVLNGSKSNVVSTNAGVPQGSILGPIFFLIFINDIVLEVNCSIKLFADDTSIYLIVNDPISASQNLNENLCKIHQWSKKWLVQFNPAKTENLIISRKEQSNHPPLMMNNVTIVNVNKHKHLGLVFSCNGKWHDHIFEIIDKANKKMHILRSFKFKLKRKVLESMYFTFIRPILEYSDIIWDNCPIYLKDLLENINLQAGRIVTGATRFSSNQSVYGETGWPTLEQRREQHKLIQVYKIINGLTPDFLCDLLPQQFSDRHSYPTRNSSNYSYLPSKTSFHYYSFFPSSIRLWNNLDPDIRTLKSLKEFKHKIVNKIKIPEYYHVGTRPGQIYHTRIRMRCSSLKQHLYHCNLIDSQLCPCGKIESAAHYLLHCPFYSDIRDKYIKPIQQNLTCNLLLFGDDRKSIGDNCRIFENVQKFIIKSKRFDP